jgi:hydrogenase nickel incorporation protein HypA/HybF
MHELGVVFTTMDTLEDLGRENELCQIARVTMRLGEVSGILQDYFVDCWQWAQKRSDLLRDSRLELEVIPAVTLCTACERTYPTVRHGRTCPHCGSDQTYLLAGNEIEIKEIEGC